MSKRLLIVITLLISILVLAACGSQSGEEEEPTPEPDATEPAEEPTVPPLPTNTPAPTAEPTAVPTIDPSVMDELPDWDPQLVFSSPSQGEESLLDGAITLRFDQPMDQGSVEEAFSIAPEVTGDIQWPRPDLMIFTPRDQLDREQTYQVLISDSAQSAGGKTLREPVSLEIQTIGALEVSAVIPSDGTQNVDIDGAITVLFNRPVVPLVSTQDQAGLVTPLSISPAVEGEGTWISTSIYRFTPTSGFAGATNYSVTIPQGLTDVTGAVLESGTNFTFSTQQPRVENVRPFQGEEGWPLDKPFTVQFNMEMDPANTEAAISVSSSVLAGSVPVEFEWNETNTSVVITPTQRLEIESSYQLTIDQSATAASGQGGLDQTTTIPFSTVPLPRVIRTEPNNGDLNYPPYGYVGIEFSAPMDWSTLKDRIQIEPEPERVDYFYYEGDSWLNLNFNMRFNQDYQITIPADAADPYGNTLGEPYLLTFTTGEADPFINVNLPYQVVQFSASFAPQIDVTSRNVNQLNIGLYDAGLPVEDSFYGSFWGDIEGMTAIREQTILLENVQNETVVNRIDINNGEPLPTGVYALTINAPKLEARDYRPEQFLLVVADTNLVVKETVDGLHVWATDMATGQPAPNRLLAVYDDDINQVATGETNGDGYIFFDLEVVDRNLWGYLVISETPGGPGFGYAGAHWSGNVNPWQLNIQNNDASREAAQRGYIYAERPIYRPGDTLFFRGIARDQNYGRYGVPAAGQTVTVRFSELNFYGPDEPFSTEIEVALDENGTVAGEFAIPDGVNPGQYNLEFYDTRGELYASSLVQVAEFRKPEFEVTVSSAESDILRGNPAQVTVEANYFFGGVASDLDLTYTVYETPYFYSHPSPYRFGESLPFYWFYDQQQGYENWIFSGEGRTDADGRFVIDLPADLLAEIENGSRNITVEATVFDVNFQPFSARTSLVYHESEVYVGIQSDTYIGEVDEPLNFEILTVDWDGEPAANTSTEVIFYRREWERGESGWYEEVEIEVDRAAITTDGEGIASARFIATEGGSYKAVATATDAGGRTNSSTAYVWVTGGGRWRIEANEKTMDLVPNQLEYAVGDTAEILIQSPFEGPITAWLNIERGNILEQRLITLNSTGDTLALPITLDHVPNVYVTVVAVKGENAVASGSLPSPADYADIRVGMINLPVKIDPFKLNVELTPRLPDSGLFQPGETATFDVSIRNQNGQPIQGTISLALVDKAIFSLAADSNVPIEQAFYNEQPYRSLLGSGLIFSGEGYERPPEEVASPEPVELAVAQSAGLEVEEEAVFEESAVAAPLAEADFADDAAVNRAAGGEALTVDIDIRTDFRDTAYWEAAVTTDASGQAVVEIPLPDNLTTWKLHVKGLTTETFVGQQDSEIVVQKPLLLRPITPRFFTVGDVAEIGTVVNNNTAEELEVTVAVEGTGFEFINETAEETVTVPANGSVTVRQPIRISDRNVDFVDLTFTAASTDGRYSDGSKPTFGIAPDQLIPVYRYNAEDIVATSGVLDSEEARRVEAVLLPDGIDQDFGDIAFKLNGSLAAAVFDGLEAQNKEIYDTNCAHSVADRLIPNAVTARAISQLNLDQAELKAELDSLIPADIGHLVEAQKGDGGWGWCYWPESSPWFSAYVMLALDKAAEAGYSVPEATLQSGISYLENQLIVPGRLEGGRSYAANTQAFYHYVLAEVGAAQGSMAAELYEEQRENLDAYATGLLLIALHETEPALVETMLADISGAALVSATGAHWEDNDWNNLSSDIRATAIMIMAFAQVSPDEAFGPQAVNWLMGARKAQVWRSRHDTAWVLLGLTDWLVETGELEGDYTYSILLNGESQLEAAFNGENIAETTTLPVPMSEMSAEEINFFDLQKQGEGRLYYNAYLDAFIPADLVGPIDRGLSIERRFYDAACPADSGECEPITEIEAGQQIRVELTIITKRDLVYAVIEDYFPAGAEPIDPNLPISQQALGGEIERQVDADRYWGWWGWWYFNNISYRDERITFTSNFLPKGTYQYTYNLNATLPGTYQVRPTFGKEEFTPEVNGRGAGEVFTIVEPSE